MALDYTKKSSALILDLINTKAKRTLLAEEIDYGVPIPNEEEGAERNTLLVISPASGNERLLNDADLKYNRISLETMFGNVTQALFEDTPENFTPEAFLSAINAKYKLGLSNEDFDFATFKVEDGSAELVAFTDGLVYTGTLKLSVNTLEYLNLIMGDGNLDGFVAPNLDEEDAIFDEVPAYPMKNNVKPSAAYLNSSGNLFNNIAGANYISSTDGDMEGCIRVRSGTSGPVPTTNTYRMTKPPADQVWYINCHIGIAKARGAILDLYDVEIHIRQRSTGRVAKTQVLENPGAELDPKTYIKATMSPDRNMAYFSSRPQLIGGAFEDVQQNKSFVGEFDIILKAIRKDKSKTQILVPIIAICTE